MTWEEAIIKVLEDQQCPMRVVEITEQILSQGLVDTAGKTPNSTVAGIISRTRKTGGSIHQIGRGLYAIGDLESLGPAASQSDSQDGLDEADAFENLAVAAYGLHWERDKVDWSAKRILGYDSDPRQTIDFAGQQGVYLLHNFQSVVYVGRTAALQNGLFSRLDNHNSNQLWSRKWERFSWFGMRRVNEDGRLIDGPNSATKEIVTALMEAVLIEALGPSFNQQQGNYMGTLYRQARDPKLS